MTPLSDQVVGWMAQQVEEIRRLAVRVALLEAQINAQSRLIEQRDYQIERLRRMLAHDTETAHDGDVS